MSGPSGPDTNAEFKLTGRRVQGGGVVVADVVGVLSVRQPVRVVFVVVVVKVLDAVLAAGRAAKDGAQSPDTHTHKDKVRHNVIICNSILLLLFVYFLIIITTHPLMPLRSSL